MLTVVLITLSALPGTPRAPADAEVVTWVPRLDRLAELTPFFRQAGERSVVLRPESWREEAFPLLRVDVTSRESLEAVGADPAGALSLSRRGDFTWSCLALSDPKRFVAAADERLKRLGEPFRKEEAGVTTAGARDPLDRVLGAYAVKGKEVCAVTGHGLSVEKLLPELPRLFAKPAAGPGLKAAAELPGVAWFVKPSGAETGAVGLTAERETLRLELKARGLPLGELAGPGPSPFATFQPPGMAVVRFRVTPAAVAAVLDELVRRLPAGGALAPAAKALAPALTGNMAVLLQSVRVTQGLRTPEARFFAVRLALLAEASDPAKAGEVVEALDPKALALREGKVEVALRGNVVVLSNDPGARDAAVAALEKAAGRQPHAGELVVDPAAVARGLAQVPLLEAVRSPELAGVLAASAELGPLLLGTRRVTGWLDAAGPGATRGQLTWTLQPAKVDDSADAGVDAGR